MDPAQLTNLREVISPTRFGVYLDDCAGDPDRAVRLYTWNIEVSAALCGPMHALEITLRNSVHTVLEGRFGREGWRNDPKAQLHTEMRNQIEGA